MSGLNSISLNSSMNLNASGIMSMSTSTLRPISSVQVHPAALFAILDHYLRRPQQSQSQEQDAEDQESESTSTNKQSKQQRVIGTLLGNRTNNSVEIKSSFAVPHLEDSDQVQVDMQYHKEMLDLYLKTNPNELIVGWYSTGKDLVLDSYSALIHDYYSKDSVNGQAIHLTFDTNVKDENMGVKAYYSSPLGLTPKPSSTNFVPIPISLLTSETEKPTLSLLSQQNHSTPLSDLDSLSVSLKNVQESLERVLGYVRKVLNGEIKGDPVIGRFVLDAVGSVNNGKVGLEGMELDNLFNSHLQDVLMISYLANVIRAQAEVSSRLQLLT